MKKPESECRAKRILSRLPVEEMGKDMVAVAWGCVHHEQRKLADSGLLVQESERQSREAKGGCTSMCSWLSTSGGRKLVQMVHESTTDMLGV
jgi:hypothetical protein